MKDQCPWTQTFSQPFTNIRSRTEDFTLSALPEKRILSFFHGQATLFKKKKKKKQLASQPMKDKSGLNDH